MAETPFPDPAVVVRPYDDARQFLDSVEIALTAALDDEQDRLEKELEFLKKIYSGITGDAAIEDPSTAASDIYLTGLLTDLFPGAQTSD